MLISLNSFAWLDGFYDFVGKNYTFGLVREASFRHLDNALTEAAQFPVLWVWPWLVLSVNRCNKYGKPWPIQCHMATLGGGQEAILKYYAGLMLWTRTLNIVNFTRVIS